MITSSNNRKLLSYLPTSFQEKIWPLYLPIFVLIAHACSYLPYISDDALISLRYADRLIHGYGLTWSTGHAVEGYSNLAWILLVSLPGFLGLDLILTARLLGITCMILVLLVNSQLWLPLLTDKQIIFLVIAQFAFALSGSTAIWAIAGLEQPLLALCVVLTIFYLFRASQNNLHTKPLIQASLWLGILCLTRPDSPLLCAALAIAVMLIHGINKQAFIACCKLAIFPILFLLAQIIFRLNYYGEWLPNTALIKMTPSWHFAKVGALYLLLGITFLGPMAYFSIKALLKNHNNSTDTHSKPLVIIIATVAIIWCAYIIFIGGDIFPGFRHLVIVVALFTLAFPLSASYLSTNKKYHRKKYILGMTILFIALQFLNPFNIWARLELWHWDGEVIAHVLTSAFGDEQPLIAVDGAGTLPYFTGFPAIDMLGLNDYHIARTTPNASKSWFVGHSFSDVDYVLKQKPDIIDYCYQADTDKICTANGGYLAINKTFIKEYHSVYLLGFNPHQFGYALWFRKDSQKVGVKKLDDYLEIPAYFFRLENGLPVVSYLNQNNVLVVDIDKGEKLSYMTGELLNNFNHIEAVPNTIKLDAKIEQNGELIIQANKDEVGQLQAIKIYSMAKLLKFSGERNL